MRDCFNTPFSEKKREIIYNIMYAVIVLSVLGVALFAVFSCDHSWSEATCMQPKTCILCRATRGEAAAHNWTNATCVTPRTCKVCKKTEGILAPHVFVPATCTKPRICEICLAEEGRPLGHAWSEATCKTAKLCTVCSATEGQALGHSYKISVVKKATAAEPGIYAYQCVRCDQYYEKTMLPPE